LRDFGDIAGGADQTVPGPGLLLEKAGEGTSGEDAGAAVGQEDEQAGAIARDKVIGLACVAEGEEEIAGAAGGSADMGPNGKDLCKLLEVIDEATRDVGADALPQSGFAECCPEFFKLLGACQ
jgi:hypothetical protein